MARIPLASALRSTNSASARGEPEISAYERDPAAIEAWKRDTYPSIAAPDPLRSSSLLAPPGHP